MASLEPRQSTRPGKKRSNKRSTRVDMTAMVDVAFLLLTFFILTTQLVKDDRVLTTAKPVSDKVGIACDKNLTLYLGENDQIYWFAGCEMESVQVVNFGSSGIRQLIYQKLQTQDDLIISVKPGANSNFKNLVDIIDELGITNAPKYALADMSPEEEQYLATRNMK